MSGDTENTGYWCGKRTDFKYHSNDCRTDSVQTSFMYVYDNFENEAY